MEVQIYFNPETQKMIIKAPSDLGGSLLILDITLGFSEVKANEYILDARSFSKAELFNTVRSLVDLLVSEKIKFTADKEALELIKKANDDLKKREIVKITAINLLKNKIISTDELASAEFKRKLKKYQEEPVRVMTQLPNTANFSVPGSGKTTMLYAAYSRLKETDDIQKLFIIAPSAAYLAWAEEYEKCFDRKAKIARITGPKYIRVRFYHEPEKHEIFITTYQTAASDVKEISNLLRSARFLLVLDESHNIKRFGGGVWSSAVLKLAAHATRRVILTGTPVPNSLFDLWSQFHFLDPEIVGTQVQFKNIVSQRDAENILRKNLMPYYRRVKKKDLDLPDPIYKSVVVRAPKLQKRIYDAIKNATLEEFKYDKSDRMFLKDLRRAMMIRLMQAASNPSLLFEKSEEFQLMSIKKDRIAKYIEPTIIEGIKRYSKFEMPVKLVTAEKLVRHLLGKNKNKKILLWSVWVKNLKILEKLLGDLSPAVIYGDVPINEKQDPIDNRELRIKKFKTDPSCRVMIANPGACGESISLHDVCHDAIYVDRTFNAGQYMQSLDRIHRVGLSPSTKTHYYLLEVKDTIDETINRRLDEKRARMAKILNEDFRILNLETSLGEISDISEDSQKDFDETIKDLKK